MRHLRFALARRAAEELERAIPTVSLATSVEESLLRRRLEPIKSAGTLDELLNSAHIVYKAPGDACQSGLPDKCIDLFYSYAVLEHVPEKVVAGLAEESRRVLKPCGVAFHSIGLHDHYNTYGVSKVNFLRYPEWAWKFFVKNRISYHNRMREKEFLSIFQNNGAHILDVRHDIDPADLQLLQNMKVDKRFNGMTPEELAVSHSEIIYSFAV